MRLKTSSSSVATLVGLVGTGLIGMFPDAKWIGGCVIVAGILIFLYDLHIDNGQIETGSPKLAGARFVQVWPQILKIAVIGALVIGLGWLLWLSIFRGSILSVVGLDTSPDATGSVVLIEPPRSVLFNPDGSKRIFIPVSPNEIKANFDGRTNVQANALNAPYLGKWTAITGKIGNIYSNSDGATMVDFGSVEAIGSGAMMVQANFESSWHDQLSVLKKGQKISIACKIDDIEELGMALSACELINP